MTVNNHPPHSFAKASERRLNPLPSRAGRIEEEKIINVKSIVLGK